MSAAQQLFQQGRARMGLVIAGQTELLDQALLTVLCGGHALLEGVPGVAKTLAVKTLARLLGLEFKRVQGTPDMMPADILGTSIFSPKTNEFSLHKGPVFTQFLLADEINRMPPRTQAALLESMEERQVTMDGEAQPLDEYFTVFATQNPLEFEGDLSAAGGTAGSVSGEDSGAVSDLERREAAAGTTSCDCGGAGSGADSF